MLGKLFQVFFTVGAAFAPIAALAGGHGGSDPHMWIMQESLSKAILMVALVAGAAVIAVIAVKLTARPENSLGAPPA